MVRTKVWVRYRGRCIWPTCRVGLLLEAMHAHEVVFRSQGGDPLDITGIVPVCAICHADIHGRVGGIRKRIEGTEETGYQFYERENGELPWMDVTPPSGFMPPPLPLGMTGEVDDGES